jgi:hypothetical protein
MSRIKIGQKVVGSIVDILNREFLARTKTGQPLAGWQRSAWPRSVPFLKEKGNSQNQAVVWFPYVTDNSKAEDVAGWLNVVNRDRSVITTTYNNNDATFEDICQKVVEFIGKIHIIFGRSKTQKEIEFYGVYSSERDGDSFVYRRIAEEINTQDWQR